MISQRTKSTTNKDIKTGIITTIEKITVESRNPVYQNLLEFLNRLFELYSDGYTLSKERHSPWYYPLRVTMAKEIIEEKTIPEVIAEDDTKFVNRSGLTTKELLEKEKAKKGKVVGKQTPKKEKSK